jgi:predicted permease
VLSCCGALLGLALAAAGTSLVSQLDAFNIPLLARVQLDAAVCGFIVLVAVATGLIFGLMPALQVPAAAIHATLKENTRTASDSKRHGWIRGALVVSEVTLACVLLVGTGLLIRSLLRVLDVNLGFRPERVAELRIDPSGLAYSDTAKRNAYVDQALASVRGAAGIRGAALTDILPLDGDRGWQVAAEGQVYPPDRHPETSVRVISDAYFETMGIAVEQGRDFSPHDRPAGEPVAIINDMLARVLWPGQNPIGQRIHLGGDAVRRVIGVVGAVRFTALEGSFGSEMYVPIRQTDDYGSVHLVVRTDLPPATLASSVRAALAPIEPNLPTREWRTIQDLIDKAASPRRFVVWLLAGFSVFALVLASLGIYGVIAYSVSQRKQEIAIRMALGAAARDVQARIMLQTLGLAGLGMLIGIAASWLLGRTLTGLLFGVTATDPMTYAGMALLLGAVAALAGYLPARRAARIDPIIALRAQ